MERKEFEKAYNAIANRVMFCADIINQEAENDPAGTIRNRQS
jgi:hypothetical protein